MKRVAISGASGFVGRNLVEYLAKSKKYTLRVSKGDLLDASIADKFLKDTDILINLVGGFTLPFSDQVKKNILVLESLCNSAVQNKVQKIIHISAVAAYGSPKTGKVFKEEDKLNPDTLYGLSKKMGEEVLHYYQKNYGLKYIVLRPPNIYGPGSDHGVTFNFVKSIINTGQVTIEGSGTQKRDFLFVEDLVRAIDLSIISTRNNEVFNITNGKIYNLLEVVKVLEKVVDKKIKIIYKESIKSSKNVSAGNQKAKKKLGWSPRINLEKGLQLTYNSLK